MKMFFNVYVSLYLFFYVYPMITIEVFEVN
jgi:hypothetical protein